MISIPLLADILSVDSTATSGVTTALGTATQPLELDVNKWFSRAMMNDWLNSGINFGIRVVLAILLFLIGRWVIRRLLRIFERVLKRREIDGVAVTLLGSVLTALLYIALFLTLGCCAGLDGSSCGDGTEWTVTEPSWWSDYHGDQALLDRGLYLGADSGGLGTSCEPLLHRNPDAR